MLDRPRRSSYTDRMMRCRLGVIGLLCAALCGCQQPPKPFEPTWERVETGDLDAYDRLCTAAASTLRRHGFRLDRLDRRAGVITTSPQTSQHFFEFWRRDVDSAYDWFDATINPMRRRVELTIGGKVEGRRSKVQGPTFDLRPSAFDLVIRVTVHKERLSAPDRQFNDAGAAYQFFGFSLPSTTGQPVITPADERWVPQGRDGAMERYLLREILIRAGMTAESAMPHRRRGW